MSIQTPLERWRVYSIVTYVRRFHPEGVPFSGFRNITRYKEFHKYMKEFILKRVYIKLKVSSWRAFLWWTNRTSMARQERSYMKHEKNSRDAVRLMGTTIPSIFCAQSGASNCLTICKRPGENRYPGAFPPVLETFVVPFSRPNWLPLSLRGWEICYLGL